MEIKDIADVLMAKVRELNTGPEVLWRYPARAPKNPLRAVPKSTWRKWGSGGPSPLEKNRQNWFYGEVEFPKTKCGIKLQNAEAWLFMGGWCPFTLWLDGEEVFKETHAWHATGPIADPLIKTVRPGRKYHLIACLQPTELPEHFSPISFRFNLKQCVETGLELSAAAFQLRYAKALAENAAERKSVSDAARLIDPEAVKANRWARVSEGIAAMEADLAWLKPRARQLKLHLIGHSHIDMDWLWTWPDTEHCIRRDFKSMTDMMCDYPDLTFTHSQIPTYDVVKKKDPGVFRKVKQLVAEGRWENAAGTWVEGDLNMADGESIARHMLYAADWGAKHLSTQAKVLWEPDTFGHPGNMPQLAALGEHDCYFHSRCNPGAESNWPIRVWEGVDGTPIIAFSQNYNATILPENIISTVLEALRFGLKNMQHVWGMGDHGGALSRYQIEMLNAYRHKPVMPAFVFSTMKKLLEAVEQEKPDLPRNKGFTYNLFEGCFTTHSRIKKYNRQCEGALLTAEALSALAGLDKNDTLRDAWTDILFNHFHDIMDGAAVHDSYINAYERSESALKKAGRATREAVKLLARPTRNGSTLAVLNQLGFERTQPVHVRLPKSARCLIDSDGKAVPIQRKDDECIFIAEKVPAFASKMYTISDEVPAGADMSEIPVVEDRHGCYRIETSSAVARVNRQSGAIGSYYDKALGRELVAYGVPKHMTFVPAVRTELALNVFQIIDEAPNPMSAWLINDNLKQESLLRNAEVELLETGPVFARLRVVHNFRSSKIREDMIFYKNFPRVDFDATVDWREKGSREVGVPQLKVSFAAAMTAAKARYEGPFVVMELPADGQEYSTQKWADLSGDDFGFALYNDSKYGCDALGGRMRITLLRNSYGPDPESDNGVHTMRFAFEPHRAGVENASLLRAGMAFNRPLVCARTDEPARPLQPRLTIKGRHSVVCTALRRAEHDSSRLKIRFFETAGKRCTMRFSLGDGITSAREVNFLENPTEGKAKVEKGWASTRFHPYEVKTLLVKCRGLS